MTPLKNRQPLVFVCHWCKVNIPDDIAFRTDLQGIQPLGSAGIAVCGPACPDRPSTARVWKRTHWSAA